MAELNLTPVNGRQHEEFQPVNITDGITMKVIRDTDNGKVFVEGEFVVDGREKISDRFVYDEQGGRMFVNLNTDGMTRETAKAVIAAIGQTIDTLTK